MIGLRKLTATWTEFPSGRLHAHYCVVKVLKGLFSRRSYTGVHRVHLIVVGRAAGGPQRARGK